MWALTATFVDGSRAWIAAAAFALYPRHGESVAWVSGNTDLLAVAAVLAVLLLVRAHGSLATRAAGVAALTAVATLSKEIAFTMPVLALLMLRWNRGRRELVLPAAILLVEAGTFAARLAEIGGIGGYNQYPWTPKRMVGSAASYVLASGTPPTVPAFRYPLVFLLPAALLGIAVWRLLVLRRRGAREDVRLALMSAAWFIVALLPLLSLPVDLNNANGERNILLASVGLALVLAALIPVPRRALGAAAATAALVVLAALSVYESFDWVEAGRLNRRLLPAAEALAPGGGELVLLSAPEHYRTAHLFIGGNLSSQFRYRGSTGFTTAFCTHVELRGLRSGAIRFKRGPGGSYRGLTGWAAPFDFPVLRSETALTGECSYSRLPGGPEPVGLGLRALVTPAPSRSPVVVAYFDGRDWRRCC